MTDTEKLALAMEAIEEADGIVSQTFFPHDEPGVKWCECCHRPVRDDGKLTHKDNCDLARYLELRKKLEAAMDSGRFKP